MSSRNSLEGSNWEEIKEAVLGKSYELSLVFCDNRESRRLNRIYRGKDNPTNILSFPLSKTSGEIFINAALAKKEAKKFLMDEPTFIKYLFIHGLLHLKGLDHGATMEKREKHFLERFKNGAHHISGNRRRNIRSKGRRR